ncbi:MAG: hypothetical protein Q4D89_12145 [Arachnia propionica]|uniref:DUF6891 domain-containing protein n=1 Tax=Arachnia propionica TaxID=1750 RepID=UPI0026F83926|nr:hypothetical protein [Arachnia propionica]
MSQVTPLPSGLTLPPTWRGRLDTTGVEEALDQIRLAWGWIVSGQTEVDVLTRCLRMGSWASRFGTHADRDLVAHLLTFRCHQLATASADLDRPRLDEAFAELRRRGVVALVDFFCCGYCLGSVTGYEHPALDQVASPPQGFLFLQESRPSAPPGRQAVLVNCGVLGGGCDQPPGGSGTDPAAGSLIDEVVAPTLVAHGFTLSPRGRHQVIRDAAWGPD